MNRWGAPKGTPRFCETIGCRIRGRAIDIARVVPVLLMVWGHMMQFFADAQIFPLAQTLIDAVNVSVFPAFVF